jgi:hypothetical protein
MNDPVTGSSTATHYAKFVWRRLEEPLRIFNFELPWQMWIVLLAFVLAAALFYVVWMYVKDSRGVGPWWASLLGFLRLTVYAILALVFLLPANQSYVKTRSEGKVVVAWDVSGSLHTSDELPDPSANTKRTTRMEYVMEFLKNDSIIKDDKITFLPALEKKNPVTAYRIGANLDEEYLHFAGGRVWTRQEREKPRRDEDGVIILPPVKPLDDDYLTAWLNPNQKVPEGAGLSKEEQERLGRLGALNAKLVKEGFTRNTNLGDTLLAIINKELNNRVQGIVLFTDGRNTVGSPNAFSELAQRAKSANIPIFVVGVGEDRQKVKIEIVDLRLPPQIQPEDKFRTVAEITGEGLAAQKLDITLEITHVRTTRAKTKDKNTGKEIVEEKEEPLDIELVEKEDPDNPKATRAKISLGKKLTLKPEAGKEPYFDKATPPRVEVEWQLDAAALAKAAGIESLDKDARTAGKKWEIEPTRDDSEHKYQVLVPVDKREGLKEKLHKSEKLGMKVLKKPLRVLLFASAANRDYQFVRSLLVREMEKKRLEMAIHLQLPPGETKYREGRVQDVPPERMLTYFPDTYGKKKDLYDLSSYDVIVCFDPDWNRMGVDQLGMIKRWAEKGGGLVVVPGYINTVELIRPREPEDADHFKPILDLLPVVLADRRELTERKTDDPFALDFEGATPEMEFLKLDEEMLQDEGKFKEDWQAFFFGSGTDKSDRPQRGFYSFYPVEKAKTGSVIVARYTDPAVKLKDNTLHPFIVISPESLPRVIWIGSAETWRLREYREAYHERFWTKLLQFAANKSKGTVAKAIRLEMGKNFVQNRYVEVEAKIDGPDGNPLDRNVRPQITLVMPPGVSEKEIKQPILMSPRPGARDGWFSGRFQVRSPGEYELTLRVPKQPGQESEDTETARFTVKEANPELDNTRPDFDRMYRLASEADEVFLRMNESDRAELKRRLQRPKEREAAGGTGVGGENPDKVEIREDKPRLYFDLKNAGLIPSCMESKVDEQESRGPHQDLWDGGITIYEYPPPSDPSKPPRQPVKISHVLLIVVGLLSLEWLIRKLLRLA